jgi:hypothetical protein
MRGISAGTALVVDGEWKIQSTRSCQKYQAKTTPTPEQYLQTEI